MRNPYFSKKDTLNYAACFLSFAFLFYTLIFYFDKKIILWASSLDSSTSSLHGLFEFIDPAINIISNGAILLLLAIVLFIREKRRNPGLRNLTGLLITGFIASGMTAQALKYLVGRARPRLSFETLFYGPSLGDSFHSFPSGHTTVAFCFASILARYIPRYGVALYFIACLIGFERIEDLKHFPSDVLAGAIIGIAVGKLLSAKMKTPGDLAEASSETATPRS
jgi:membrane-associated phospholipid phosphatase